MNPSPFFEQKIDNFLLRFHYPSGPSVECQLLKHLEKNQHFRSMVKDKVFK